MSWEHADLVEDGWLNEGDALHEEGCHGAIYTLRFAGEWWYLAIPAGTDPSYWGRRPRYFDILAEARAYNRCHGKPRMD